MPIPNGPIAAKTQACPLAQLGLASGCSRTEVLQAWRRQMREVHPDKTLSSEGSTARAAELNAIKERALLLARDDAEVASEQERRLQQRALAEKRLAAYTKRCREDAARRETERVWRQAQAGARAAKRAAQQAEWDRIKAQERVMQARIDAARCKAQKGQLELWVQEMVHRLGGAPPIPIPTTTSSADTAEEEGDAALLLRIARAGVEEARRRQQQQQELHQPEQTRQEKKGKEEAEEARQELRQDKRCRPPANWVEERRALYFARKTGGGGGGGGKGAAVVDVAPKRRRRAP